ncbi:MAG TPA: hypothetical protein VFX15_12185 [Actinomycetes bacterium]|nr:hypothetical protein [Actinomycetes bacterium]
MSAPAICLHIGAMKTGTTYVQRMLGSNQDVLAEHGIAYPMPWSDQVEAVRDILKMKGGSHLGSIEGRWKLMVDRLHTWEGPRAVLSVEFISFADPDQVRTMVDDLAPSQVSVVLGARDLGRVLPAQWQTAVRNGRRTTYREYLKGVTAKRATGVKRHFWKRQDIGSIAARWAAVVGKENVIVVTVPPSRSDPGLLWQRFAKAMELDFVSLSERTPSNESLGLTGTELLRRINVQADATEMSTWSYQHGINRALSHQLLPDLPDAHTGLGVPDEYHDWVRSESARVLDELEASGVNIVGDMADLEPRLTPRGSFVWPEDLPDAELLEFAVAALTAAGGRFAELKREGMESRGGKKGRKGKRTTPRADES